MTLRPLPQCTRVCHTPLPDARFSMLQVTPSISFLIENVLVALMIIVYLAYEIRMGRGKALAGKLNGLVEVTVAIARENPNIDEESVAERLNGDAPSQFQHEDDDDGH